MEKEIIIDPNERGKQYFKIFTKATSNINWLFLSLIIFTGVNFFMLYRWHCGNIKYALMREKSNISCEKFDTFYNKVNETSYFIRNLASKDSLKSTEFKQNKLKSDVNKEIKELECLNEQGTYSTLPFLGISFYITDYLVVLLIIGLIIFYWFYRYLKFCRDTLKEYHNSPNKLDQTDAELISSLFFFVFPSSEKYKKYKQVEYGLVCYVFSIFLILVSNLAEVFFNHSYELSLIEQPGFGVFFPHILITSFIIITSLIFSIVILIKSKRYMLDIRNLVLLVKWGKKALYPALYHLFEKNKRSLKIEDSLIEYRKTKDIDKLFLCIRTVEESQVHETKGCINLPKSLKIFYKNYPNWETNKKDTYLGRMLTVEEYNMRNYFEKILTDDTYEKELCESWKKETNIKDIPS